MRKIKPSVLASLFMTFLSLLGLWVAQKDFTVQTDADSRLKQLTARVMEEKIRNEMILARLEEFQLEVAMNFPDKKQLVNSKSLRDLASVIPQTNIDTKVELKSQRMLEEVRQLFKDHKYEFAMGKSQELISKFPESTAQLEASYYLVSCYYHTGNKQEALNWSEKMLSQFPESEWTAKSLLVMADIYKEQNRKNDLLDVYQIILDTFQDENLRTDIKKRLSALEM